MRREQPTMRDFNEQDKHKKKTRIRLPENPANLPQETLGRLGAVVTDSLREGYSETIEYCLK